jgi:hypothetical protein
MSTAVLAVIIVVVVIVVAALVAVAMAAARRRRLQGRFGPEYERVVGEWPSQLKAEAELAGRERRVQDLDIRPLDAASQAEYASRWAVIQEKFVDRPADTVAQAQHLVTAVMKERGYPTEAHDQMVADLSVQHASTLEHFRAAYAISQIAAVGNASTEDLRQAMIQYRTLFSDLLGEPAGQRAERSGAAGSGPAVPSDTAPRTQPETGPGTQPDTGPGAQPDTGPGAPPEPAPETATGAVNAAHEGQASVRDDQPAPRTRRS